MGWVLLEILAVDQSDGLWNMPSGFKLRFLDLDTKFTGVIVIVIVFIAFVLLFNDGIAKLLKVLFLWSLVIEFLFFVFNPLVNLVLLVNFEAAESQVKNSLVVELHGEFFLDPHLLVVDLILEESFICFSLQRQEPEDRSLVPVLSPLLQVLRSLSDVVEPSALQEQLVDLLQVLLLSSQLSVQLETEEGLPALSHVVLRQRHLVQLSLVVFQPGPVEQFVERFEQQEVLESLQRSRQLRSRLEVLADSVDVSPPLILGVLDLFPGGEDLLVQLKIIELPHLSGDAALLGQFDPVVHGDCLDVLDVQCLHLLLQLS